ncbi:MAG: DUF4159 domain-containing protein, partial [Rhodospirillales bacterium]|nr:DUF4159 domain-containing protein [Rhodospirillales bacterium]
LDLAGKTWARLTDGTPLVTADKRGDGWLVLMHTTATPEWSNLPLSGLFVEMLQRLVALSQGVAGDAGDTPLPPLSSLDGFGRLSAPPPAALAILSRAFATTKAGPKFPPGFYGSEVGRRALNLSPGLSPLKAIAALPTGIGRGAFGGGREVDFKPWLLATALVLALVDLAASLALRGLWPKLARPGAAAILLAFLAGGGTAFAQTAPGPTRPANDDNAAVLSTLATHLGYVRTGNPDIDQVSRAGLSGLGAVLSRRTAVDPAPPIEIDIERDELAFYPLLYWPVVAESPRPSPVAMARINAFLRRGGMILFDTRDAEAIALGGVGPAGQRLRDILRQLDLPALRPIPDGHVLTKSFYLIDEFPGRWTGRPLWVEDSNDRVNDGVSSVIVGAHDWAAAWATDARGQPMFATVPGGEGQRETALRFGVNLVMYALTGNYKTDQVHVETILERLRR